MVRPTKPRSRSCKFFKEEPGIQSYFCYGEFYLFIRDCQKAESTFDSLKEEGGQKLDVTTYKR